MAMRPRSGARSAQRQTLAPVHLLKKLLEEIHLG